MGAPDEAPVSTDAAPTVRLHISPFNPELADCYLTPPVRALATDVSFHSTQTDTVRGYGFVNLPVEEATKLKQKLNGTVLKGAKVKIEEAKPDKKRKRIEPPPPCDESRPKKIPKKDRPKVKREKNPNQDVIPGHELEEGRHIKRGWEDKGPLKTKRERKAERKALKKAERVQRRLSSQNAIKYKEMRFKTVLPANATPLGPKRVKNKDKYNKNKNKRRKTTVVNEFEYARKPAIVGTNTDVAQPHVEYEDGKGWVDAEGRVVEGESEATKRKRAMSVPTEQTTESVSSSDVDEESSMLSDSSSDDDSDVDNTSDDNDDASDDNDDTSDNEEAAVAPPSETSATSDMDAEKKEIHPLEALFKRPPPPTITTTDTSTTRTKPAPIDTSFSFFDANVNDPDEAVQDDAASGDPSLSTLVIPQTPHTKRDMEWRALRSGAPTPDTAAVGRKFRFSLDKDEAEEAEQDDDDDDDETKDVEDSLESEATAARTDATSMVTEAADDGTGAEQPREESVFRKWFFDNRGDLNRSWKKRRREERKANRQRENRRASRKIA